MELIISEPKKMIFIEEHGDEKNIYTVIDMGSYVGHKERQWNEPTPKYWKLMVYDETDLEDRSLFHVEALCDDRGYYMRLILQINREFVMSDFILAKGKLYSTFTSENILLTYPLLGDYLASPKTFISEAKEKFENLNLGNDRVIRFINSNEIVLKEINAIKESTI